MAECAIELPKFHPKQQLVFDSLAREILLGGDTRGGKSFFIRKAYILWCATIPGLVCDIFRVNFDDVIKNYMQGETSFPALLQNWEKAKLVKINQAEITFWNGSVISLNHCADDNVMRKHQGVACHVRTLEESAQMLERRVRALSGWVTMSDEMKSRVPEKWKGLFPKLLHSTNPLGPSASFYRKGFVHVAKKLQGIDPPYAVFDGGPLSNRQYVPFYTDDNPSENFEATQARIKEAFPDPAVHGALLGGRTGGAWDTMVGEYFPEFSEERHVVDDCVPPPHWYQYRCMDLGYAEPFAVYWVAISDGEPFYDSNRVERWFPRDSLLYYREWYGCDNITPSLGIRMRNEDIAGGIYLRSDVNHKSVITLTDSLPFQDRGGEFVPDVFKKCGVPIIQGDTSRVIGWNQVRSRLIGKKFDNGQRIPGIFFTNSCVYARDYLPMLTRHPNDKKTEDAQEHGEATHSCDAIRIGCMVHSVVKDKASAIERQVTKAMDRATKPTMTALMGKKAFR